MVINKQTPCQIWSSWPPVIYSTNFPSLNTFFFKQNDTITWCKLLVTITIQTSFPSWLTLTGLKMFINYSAIFYSGWSSWKCSISWSWEFSDNRDIWALTLTFITDTLCSLKSHSRLTEIRLTEFQNPPNCLGIPNLGVYRAEQMTNGMSKLAHCKSAHLVIFPVEYKCIKVLRVSVKR